METIRILVSLVYLILAVMSLFSAYFFYLSKDGELRKLYIKKHLALTFLFVGFCIISLTDKKAIIILWMALFCIPYLVACSQLTLYFIKSFKK